MPSYTELNARLIRRRNFRIARRTSEEVVADTEDLKEMIILNMRYHFGTCLLDGSQYTGGPERETILEELRSEGLVRKVWNFPWDRYRTYVLTPVGQQLVDYIATHESSG